jgi:hypothetical protein
MYHDNPSKRIYFANSLNAICRSCHLYSAENCGNENIDTKRKAFCNQVHTKLIRLPPVYNTAQNRLYYLQMVKTSAIFDISAYFFKDIL